MNLLQTLPYLLPYLISLTLSIAVGVYAWRRRDLGGAAAFAIYAWAEASWTASHIFELLNPSLEGKVFWNNVEFIGLFLAPMALLVFALQYAGRKLAHPGRLWGLLAIVPILSMLLIFTDPFHRLIRPSASLIPGEPFSELDFGFSTALWGMFIYAYGLNVSSILILVARYVRSPRLYRAQIGTVVIGCLFPLFGAIPILMDLRLTGHRDVMPLLFGLGNLIVAWGLFRYRLLDIVPVAHDLVVKSMSDATLVLDAQDRLVDLNPAAQALVGRPVSEIIGQPAEQIFSHWHDLVEQYQDVEEARAEVAAHIGAEQRYFDYRISPVRDQRGRFIGRLVVARDVTEYKRAVEALKLSEEKYRALVENINDVIYSTDTQGNVTYVSPSIERFALYPVSEALGQPFARFVHPDDLPGVRASFERILAGTLEPYEFRIFAKDGSVLHVRTSSRPLSVGGQVVGLTGVIVNLTERKQAEEELEKHRHQLEKMVEERTTALKASNEQLQQEVAERKWTAALQLALYRISSEASAARDMQDFYAAIHNIVGTLMYTGNFYIALYDEDSQMLHFPYFVDEADPMPPPSPLRKGLTDYVVRTGQPLLATPEVFQQLVDGGEVELFGAPSVDWLGVPLKSAEKTIGVIGVQSYNEAIRFSEKEKNLLTFVSQQIASTLERKRAEEALNRRAAQLAILNDIGKQIVAVLELNHVLDRATRLIQENFGYHHVAIFTVDREQGKAVMKTKAGLFVNLFSPDHHLKMGQGMIGWVAQHGELLLAGDVRTNPHFVSFYPDEIPTRSELSVPIRVGQDIVGVLDAQSPQLDDFDENDVMVMETLADQIALAMVNAQLYESIQQELAERKEMAQALRQAHDELEERVEQRTAELKKANEQLAALYRVGQAITEPLRLRAVLDVIARNTAEVLGTDTGVILLVDEAERVLTIQGAYGISEEVVKGTQDRIGESIAGRVVQTGQPIIANDLPHDPRFYNPAAANEGLLACASVPLIAGRKIIGTLDVHSKTNRDAFTEEHIQVLSMLAGQAAIAIEKARLYEQLQVARDELEVRVQQRTVELVTANAQLQQEIIERKRAEEALRESEAQYRSLFENSPLSLWEEDFSSVKAYLDGLQASEVADFREYFASHSEAAVQCASLVKITNVNQATLNLFKATTREELYGGLDRVFVDESFGVFREELLALIEGHTPFESEMVGQPLTGDPIRCIMGVSIAPGYEETWAKVFVSIVDITERVQTEVTLQRHMGRMEILHEIDHAILVAQSPEATAQVALDRLRQLTGCPRISVSLFDFQANRAWALAISTAAPSQITAGMRVSLEAFGLYWIKVLQQRRPYIAEDVLKMPEISEGDRVLAAEGLRAWLALPLVYQGELIGSLNLGASEPGPFDAGMIDLAGQVADQLAIAIQQARLLEQVQRHATELEQRVAERTAELRAAYERLQALDRIKDEFVSNVSHELRTPIASLKLYLHMLDLRPDKRASYMVTLERETARLEDLIENILTLSRLDQERVEISPAPVDLNTLVGEYVTDRTPLAESKGLTLAFKPGSKIQTVKADHGLLGQVLGILLTNALSYTPTGGQIVVHTRKRRFAGQSWAGFSVSDTGPGIPAEEQAQLFTRFFRGKVGRESGTPGTGLGLAIAKEIVERHQGRIELDGKGTPNKGATFCVWLPASVS